MNLEKISKINWQYLVSRRESVLFRSFTDDNAYFKRATGFFSKNGSRLHLGNGEVYRAVEDLADLKDVFRRGGIRLFKSFKLKLIRGSKDYYALGERIKNIDFSQASKTELARWLKLFSEKALIAHNFLSPLPVADKVLTEKILSALPWATDEQKQEWLGILTYPTKENEHTREERSFLNLALARLTKDKKFNSLLAEHLREFSWIGARNYYWERAWTRADIEKRLDNFFRQKKDPRQELKYLNDIRKERKREFEKLLKRLKIKRASAIYNFIILIKEFAFLRTWRSDQFHQAGFKAKDLFYEIVRRSNIKTKDAHQFSHKEFSKMIKNWKMPISEKELADRKKGLVTIFLKGRYEILSGSAWEKKVREIFPKTKKGITEIKGQAAFGGKARGRIRLVLSTADMEKVKRGDIMAAVMTFPNFIPAMEKAAAFVTDEGGILCHAAIVSREMKKPCLIATKIATKVLHDGDFVEVDADRGIVKIIKDK